jgi:hypothetical protein
MDGRDALPSRDRERSERGERAREMDPVVLVTKPKMRMA